MEKEQEYLRQLTLEIFNKDKWWDILSRFIDVLRINIFIVDCRGGILLPPEEGRYGGKLLRDRAVGFDLAWEAADFLKKFEYHGPYLEFESRLKLRQYAIPISINGGTTIGYMVVGPLILNKRLGNAEYEQIAAELHVHAAALMDEINGLRIVSNVMVHSILDLLHEIVKNNIELSGMKKEIYRKEKEKEVLLPHEIRYAAKDLFSTVCLDELLVTLLDVALKMTDTECGSVMIADQEKGGDLTVKVSRGLDEAKIRDARVKIGEGVSGLAAQERRPLVIHGQEGNNRLKPYLERPEIRHALVMPLVCKNRVFGILNLHTKQERCSIEGNLENLQYLTRLLALVV